MSKRNRSLSELQQNIDEEYATRIIELNEFKNRVFPLSGVNSKKFARSLIVMLYAHWEGFIKNSSENYLQFVSSQNHKYNELQFGLVAISQMTLIKDYLESNIALKIRALQSLFLSMKNKAVIPYSYQVSTYGNLNTETLREICMIVGIDHNKFDLKKGIIDEKLLRLRNEVAHGVLVDVLPQDILDTYDLVIPILSEFKNDILNSATLKGYLLQTK